jgi:4-hydroxy-2-oxoheptanedioate aldolase
MVPNRLLERLRRDEVCLGLSTTLPAPGIIECMCRGWDFVWIDAQHGQYSYDTALHAVRAAAALGIEALVRVPGPEHSTLCLYADLAPAAIMVPMVNSAAEAEHVVRGLRFPPRGVRSFGGRRVADLFGRNYPWESELAVVVQIETGEAVANSGAIAAVDGIDCLFVGPDDMKMSLGIPMDVALTGDPRLQRALEQTAQGARAHGKAVGCVCPTAELARFAVSRGVRLLAGGGDGAFLKATAAARLGELRSAVGG